MKSPERPARMPVPLPYAGFIAGLVAIALFCWVMLDAALGGAA